MTPAKVTIFGALTAALALAAAAAMVTPAEAQMMGRGMMGGGMMGGGMMGGGTPQGTEPSPSAPGAAGAAIFRNNCAGCHTLQAGAPNGLGPNLHGLFGRKAGSVPGYTYSPAMRNANVVWNAKTLDAYLAAPQSVVPGNRMAFPGIPNAAERQALITYLQAATR